MKTKKLPHIGLEQFKKHPGLISYMDDDIAVIDSISEMMETNIETAKTDCFLMAFCIEGTVVININGEEHSLGKDYCAILPPGTIIRKTKQNQPYILKIAVASSLFLTETLCSTKETWSIFNYLHKHPIHPIKKPDSYKLYLYKELLITLLKEDPHIYSFKTRRYHLAGMFCEMMVLLSNLIPENERTGIKYNRASIIVHDFMELVNNDSGIHRSVSYYADELCYSAKYLSSIVKLSTGQTPIQIISQHTIKQIKYKLRNSDLSIKELADYFDFPNPSFFGKFVKTHLGTSPMQYRLLAAKESE